MLKSGYGAGLRGKRGFQVSEGLLCGLPCMWQVGRRAALGQSSAYVALAVHKTLPDSVGRRDAEIELCGAQGLRSIAQTNHEFEECPQALCTEAQAPEFISGPYAERVSAAVVVLFTIVAEDPPSATRLSIIVALGIAEQPTVENQRSGRFAGRARREFQAMIQAQEIILGTVELRERKAQRNPPKAKSGDYTGLRNPAAPRRQGAAV